MKVFRVWESTWRGRCPKAVGCLARDIDKLLQFLKCPVEHHRIIRTTNIIERLFKELRRRLRVMGAFSDADSCKRITYSLFAYHNTRWTRTSCRMKQIGLTQLPHFVVSHRGEAPFFSHYIFAFMMAVFFGRMICWGTPRSR